MLEKQVFPISVDGNMDQYTDDKLVDPGSKLLVLNARREKLGKLSKRFGRQEMPLLTSLGDNIDEFSPNRILSDGRTLYVDTKYKNMFAFSDSSGKWESISGLTDSCFVESKFTSKNGSEQKFPDNDYEASSGLLMTSYIEEQTDGSLPIRKVILTDITRNISKEINLGDGLASHVRSKILKVASAVYPVATFWDQGASALVSKVLNRDGSVNFTHSFTAYNKYETIATDDKTSLYIASLSGTNLRVFRHGVSTSLTLSSLTVTNTYNGKGISLALSGDNLIVSWGTVNGYAVIGVDTVSGAVSISEVLVTISVGYNTSVLASCVGENSLGSQEICIVASSGESVDSLTTYRYRHNNSTLTVLNSRLYYRMGILGVPFSYNRKFFLPLRCSQSGIRTGYVVSEDNISSYFSRDNLPGTIGFEADNYFPSRTVMVGDEKFVVSHRKSFRSITISGPYEQFGQIAVANTFFDFKRDYRSGSRFKIGENLHLVSGKLFELDGRKVFENNFPLIPGGVTVTTGISGGSIVPGLYRWRVVLEYYDGNGQLSRSRPSDIVTATVGAGENIARINLGQTYLSDKGVEGDYNIVAVAYRTKVGGAGVFYRSAEARMIGINIAANGFVIYDQNSDSAITDNEILYTEGGVLENDPAPIARFGCVGINRVFLGGLENRFEIAYSKKVYPGESVAFSDLNRIYINQGNSKDSGEPTANGFLDDKLIIFKENSMEFISGDGPLDTGLENTFTDPQSISSDGGCDEPRSVVNIPQGLMYKSKKGFYLLNRNLTTEFIGAGVDNYKDEKILSSSFIADMNEVRFLTDGGNILVYNFQEGSWRVSEASGIIDSDTYDGREVVIMDDGLSVKPLQETDSTFQDANFYPLKVVTPWLKFSLVQGVQRVWRVLLIGDCKSPHTLVLRAYYNYDDTVYDEYERSFDTAGSVLQWRIHLKRQVCQAIKFEVFDKDQSGSGESYTLSNIQVEAGMKKGSAKLGSNKTN